MPRRLFLQRVGAVEAGTFMSPGVVDGWKELR